MLNIQLKDNKDMANKQCVYWKTFQRQLKHMNGIVFYRLIIVNDHQSKYAQPYFTFRPLNGLLNYLLPTLILLKSQNIVRYVLYLLIQTQL